MLQEGSKVPPGWVSGEQFGRFLLLKRSLVGLKMGHIISMKVIIWLVAWNLHRARGVVKWGLLVMKFWFLSRRQHDFQWFGFVHNSFKLVLGIGAKRILILEVLLLQNYLVCYLLSHGAWQVVKKKDYSSTNLMYWCLDSLCTLAWLRARGFR